MSADVNILDKHELIKVQRADGSWNALIDDWRAQCVALDEDFDSYAEGTFEVLEPLSQNNDKRAGLFALKEGDKHLAICQINCAMLPKHDGPVMRVRFITLSPDYDLTDKNIKDYGGNLVALLFQVIKLAIMDDNYGSRHIKFHLRSPSDISFFSAISHGLAQESVFHSVQMSGAWLYITRH